MKPDPVPHNEPLHTEDTLDLTEFPCYASASLLPSSPRPAGSSPVTRSIRKRSSVTRIEADEDEETLPPSKSTLSILLYTQYLSPRTLLQDGDVPSASDLMKLKEELEQLLSESKHRMQVVDENHAKVQLWLNKKREASEEPPQQQQQQQQEEEEPVKQSVAVEPEPVVSPIKVQHVLNAVIGMDEDADTPLTDVPSSPEEFASPREEPQVLPQPDTLDLDSESEEALAEANNVLETSKEEPLTLPVLEADEPVEMEDVQQEVNQELQDSSLQDVSMTTSEPIELNVPEEPVESIPETEPVQEPVKQPESPKKQPTSPKKQPTSPKKQSTSPIKQSTSPVKPPTSPVKELESHVKEMEALHIPVQVSDRLMDAKQELDASQVQVEPVEIKQEPEAETKKRKREADEAETSLDAGITRRTDGNVQLEISNSGTIKIMKTGHSPPPLNERVALEQPSVPWTPSTGGKNLSAIVAATPKSRASQSKDKKKKQSTSDVAEQEKTASSPFLHGLSLLDKIMPKEMPQGDYSKVKPTNQIPLANFISYSEQYFRNINDEDVKWLEKEDDHVLPFVIPSLGVHYREQWSMEDGFAFSSEWDGRISTPSNTAATVPSGLHSMDLSHKEYEELDGTVYPGDIYFGPLTERLVCSLVEDGVVEPGFFDLETSEKKSKKPKNRQREDLVSLEDRIREELAFIGLYQEDTAPVDQRENDEICTELKALQAQLREQVAANAYRRKRLAEVAKLYMAWQEYNLLLDEQNKQIESAYSKRFKTSKKQKKKVKTDSIKPPVSENVIQLIEARNRLLTELGSMFNIKSFTLPTNSIYDKDYKFEFHSAQTE